MSGKSEPQLTSDLLARLQGRLVAYMVDEGLAEHEAQERLGQARFYTSDEATGHWLNVRTALGDRGVSARWDQDDDYSLDAILKGVAYELAHGHPRTQGFPNPTMT